MKHVIAVLGAGALSLASGAVLGSAIPTAPLSYGNGLDHIAPPPIQRFPDTAQATPNHYPLKTAGGVVPVEELSTHGLYRNRYRPFTEAAYDPEAGPSLVEMAESIETIDTLPPPEPRYADNHASGDARAIDVAQELSRLR